MNYLLHPIHSESRDLVWEIDISPFGRGIENNERFLGLAAFHVALSLPTSLRTVGNFAFTASLQLASHYFPLFSSTVRLLRFFILVEHLAFGIQIYTGVSVLDGS